MIEFLNGKYFHMVKRDKNVFIYFQRTTLRNLVHNLISGIQLEKNNSWQVFDTFYATVAVADRMETVWRTRAQTLAKM